MGGADSATGGFQSGYEIWSILEAVPDDMKARLRENTHKDERLYCGIKDTSVLWREENMRHKGCRHPKMAE